MTSNRLQNAMSTQQKVGPAATKAGFPVTHLWHFRSWSTGHFLLHDFLLDEHTGHIEGAEQGVGLESQRVTVGGKQLQGVRWWVKMVVTTQINQQIHQRFTGRWEKKEEWKCVRIICVRVCPSLEGQNIGLQGLPSFSFTKKESKTNSYT